MSDSNPPDETLSDDACDPFVEFQDWLRAPQQNDRLDSDAEQKEYMHYITVMNAQLLLDPDEWNYHIGRFESILNSIKDKRKLEEVRDKYVIRFNGYQFKNSNKFFLRYRFPCSVSFRDVNFGDGEVCFYDSLFLGREVSFDDSVFGEGDVSFVSSRFVRTAVSFNRTSFGAGSVGFELSTFKGGRLTFDRTDFGNKEVGLSYTRFIGTNVQFVDSIFGPGEIEFSNSRISATNIDFKNVSYGNGNFKFDKVKSFNSNIKILNSVFGSGNIVFDGSRFESGEVVFIDTDFGSGDLSFQESLFLNSDLRLRSAHVQGRLMCNGLKASFLDLFQARIDGFADWNGSAFGSIPDFRHAELASQVEVGQMRIDGPILFGRVVDGDINDKVEKKQSISLFSKAVNLQDVLKLRKLKAMAIAANDHEKDGEFFAYEMIAKRGVEHTTFWQLLFNTIYWKVSFYGQSYLRPLGWLSASFATFAAIYSLMAALPIGGWQSLAFGITYSFKNSLPFLGTLTRSVPSPEGHVSWFALQLQAIKEAQPGPDWFTVLGTCQAMLSLFFFFFLLLGLRNKFRLK
jgi:hypothetical protein